MPPQSLGSGALRFHSWSGPTVRAIAFVSLAAGFGQFGAVAALGDVAKTFGHLASGTTVAEQAGLSGTELGVGLAILRFASLGSLFLTGLADRYGRRMILLVSCALGLGATLGAAFSPGYWWFVAIFAIGRPLLSTTGALSQVMGAEQTDAHNRARAVALVAGSYGVGSGLTAVIHGVGQHALGFRGLFLLTAVPLAALIFVRGHIVESDRFVETSRQSGRRAPVIGAIAPQFRRRLAIVGSIAFCVAVMTGPANSFVFVYGENVLSLSGDVLAGMVVVAGVAGLAGLILGQRLSDRVGRRVTTAGAIAVMSVCAVVTYSGSRVALGVGYVLGVFAASTLAPAAGALENELFPTEVRASVVGWLTGASVLGAVIGLLGFGAIADFGDHFSFAALAMALVALPSVFLLRALPETKGRELEELWESDL